MVDINLVTRIYFIFIIGIRYKVEINYFYTMQPLKKIKVKWSPEFAYAIGLLTTDGNLSIDGRHLDFTSKDTEQINNFMECLGVKVKIGYKKSSSTGRKIPRIQFGDVNFYKFLLSIGLSPAKTKVISNLKIPEKYFFDFLRGHFDGDGTFYYFWDKRWRSSFMFYTVFTSTSKQHIEWLRDRIYKNLNIKGHFNKTRNIYYLKYAKAESLKLLPKMYYHKKVVCLSRKFKKIKKALEIEYKNNKIARVL